ncbi:cytochrome P450 2K6-like [Leucoraja erinacea]|uniref:cytochrome P450 2K6-like n=1 Tax=Leucoraja erinaceus TaxID=7782 RepID=UPI0024545355|nr:cytochrome P450 2K6-like [Leucoraja erinacea]
MMFGSAFPLDAATLLILGALSLLLLLYFRRGSKCHGAINLPPGPPCLPIIGHLHLMDLKKPHESLMEQFRKQQHEKGKDRGCKKSDNTSKFLSIV